MRTLVLSSILAAASLAACSPYSPDLGAAPFRCSTDPDQDQRCPDGYTCIPGQGSNAPEVCVENGGDGKIPDGGANGNCDNDSSLEPNDSTSTAWLSPVDGTKDFQLASLAICPAGDKDVYQVNIMNPNENLEVFVEYEEGGADLQAAILNGNTPIANATATAANTKRAYVANLPVGMYYVQVSGPASGGLQTNNYKLHFVVTGG